MAEHLQTFEGGMWKDNELSFQPKGSYFDLRNGILTDNGGGNYSIKSVKGTEQTFALPYAGFTPIGFASLTDKLVVLSHNPSNNIDEIGTVRFLNNDIGVYTPVYHKSLGFSIENLIEAFCLRENEGVERVYWTDNLNQPRALNLKSPKLTTYLNSGSLVIGKQYMVVTGGIMHAAIARSANTSSNVFTASATTFTGSGTVVEYLNSDLLDFTPKFTLGEIDYKNTIAGSVFCGAKQYTYRLLSSEGYATPWSYASRPLHVGPKIVTIYSEYVGGGGYGEVLANSNKGIVITISGIDTRYSHIEVAVIEYNQKDNVISNGVGTVFSSSLITGSSMDIVHLGNENLRTVSISDLTLAFATILTLKTMDSNKSRCVIGNFTERPEFDSEITATIAPFGYLVPSDTTGVGDNLHKIGHEAAAEGGVSNVKIYHNGVYIVKFGTVVYDGNTIPVGSTFVGLPGITSFSGGGIAKACIKIKRYNKVAGGAAYKIIELNDDFLDHKGAAVSKYLRGYWREETYRFGFLAFDKFGKVFYVRWLDDITMPSQSDTDYELVTRSTGVASLRHLGVEISNLDLTDIIDEIKAFAIVRAPRDKQIIAQGLMIPTVIGKASNAFTHPMATKRLSNDANADANSGVGVSGARPFWFNIVSPELLFSDNSNFFPTLDNGDGIYPVSHLEANPGTSSFGYRIEYINNNFYDKFYEAYKYAGASATILEWTEVNHGEELPHGGLTFKNNDLGINNSGYKQAWGGRTHLFNLNHDGFANTERSGASMNVATAEHKLLVNWKRIKKSPYGGSSSASKANTLYMMCDHFQVIDDTVKADILTGGGRYIFNGIQVFGGDCFINFFGNSRALWSDDSDVVYPESFSWNIIFPCESNINTALRQGRYFTRDGTVLAPSSFTQGVFHRSADNPNNIQYEEWIYNHGYSTDDRNLFFPALPDYYNNNADFKYRARYSGLKFSGERIDNFRLFAQNNFLDVDGKLGEINNIRAVLDRAFYWQNKGVGYFPMAERELSVGSSGNPVQLGIGGIMQRFDTMNQEWGNQHQFSLFKTHDSFHWFDMRNRTVMKMGFGGDIKEYSFVKGLQTFFDETFGDIDPIDQDNIFNRDNAVVFRGITGAYDPINKLSLMTFKWISTNDMFPVVKTFTIGITRTGDKFIGFFDCFPGLLYNHNKFLLGTHPTNDNTVHTIFKNGDTGKFFGTVYPFSLKAIINPPRAAGLAICVDNVIINSDELMFDSYTYTNSFQSASDTGLKASNRNYRYIDRKWHSSVPMQKRERLTDMYLAIELTYNNLLNKIKRIVSLKSIFRVKS